MENTSQKHHYLPRHYLGGFSDNSNCLFVYDKQKDKIFPYSPADSFFENSLNTATLPDGSTSEYIEELYANLEDRCWPSFDIIRDSTSENPIHLWDRMHLFLLTLYLYWRLPGNAEFVDELSAKAFTDNNHFDNIKLEDRKEAATTGEVVDKMKQSPAFKSAFRKVVPLMPFYQEKGWSSRLMNWRFEYIGDDKSCYIVGDNPIITKTENNLENNNHLKEFVFPISGKVLLVDVDKPLNKAPSPAFTLQYNEAILGRAERFVACQNRHFLEALVKDFKLHGHSTKPGTIIASMFDMLE
jgi:hypothetical protein